MLGMAFGVVAGADPAGLCRGDGFRAARRPRSKRRDALPPASLSAGHAPECLLVANEVARPGRPELPGRRDS